MNIGTIRIVAAVIDTTKLTLYKEDGESIVLKQGDPRVATLVAKVAALDFEPYVDILLEEIKVENDYENFEKKSSGVVSFFRVAKAKLKALFSSEELVPATFGTQPKKGEVATSAPVVNKHTAEAVAEIMKHAQPVSSKTFDETNLDKQSNVVEEDGNTPNTEGDKSSPDTMVAVVDGKIIPGVEKIKSQITRAAAIGSTGGIERFMKRIASVIEQRRHSVEDLLRFLERGDLPIAEDGSILIYKLLYRNGKKDGKETYVDCHSRNVTQWVGAYVCMDEKLVDHNRSQECSNGLHVARRGYLRHFSGDVCVLAKLAPEDVIAVPHGDANKMRVCGYHIIAELSEEMRNKVQGNRPITDTTEGQKFLADAIRGIHIGKTHEVRVTGQKGSGVITKALTQGAVEPVVEEVKAAPVAEAEAPVVVAAPALVKALENPGENVHGEIVDPNAIAKAQTAVLSRKEQAKALYDDWENACPADRPSALAVLLAFKKAAKVGWDRLGIPDPETQTMVATGNKPAKAGKLKPTKQVHSVDFGDEPADRTGGVSEYVAKGVPAGKPVTDLHTREVIGVTAGSYKDRIQKLLAIGKLDTAMAQKVYDLKKQSKKSWETLGVTSVQQDNILRWLDK